jgi:hypothetical protein
MKNTILLWLCVCLVIPTSGSAAMNMIFEYTGSNYHATNIWVTVQRGQAPSLPVTAANVPGIAYGANQFVWKINTNTVGTTSQAGCLFAESVLLTNIIEAGGITWTSNAPSAAIYVSYGAPIPVSKYSLSGIAVSATPDPSYNIPYQNFEITYYGGNPNDQGDITAINFFTAPLSISSYKTNNATGAPLQSRGFHTDAATIFGQLENISAGAGASPLLTNSNGQYTRAIGPTQFGAGSSQASDFGSYTNLNGYFAALEAETNKTVFSNSSGYNTTSNPSTSVAYTNVNVTFFLTNQVSLTSNGYQFQSLGAITAVTTSYETGGKLKAQTTNVSQNVVFSVAPGTTFSNIAAAFVYYGDYSAAMGTTNISLGGSGWTSVTNELSGFVDGGGNPAASVLKAQIGGEISTGYCAGLAGSTNIVATHPGVPLGSLPSSDWWSLPNPPLFSDIQKSPFYNEYADVVYRNSSNTVYGMTYGDRFTDPNSQPYVSAAPSVGSWLVSIGDPINKSSKK